MRRRQTLRTTIAALAVAAIGLMGCGDVDDDGGATADGASCDEGTGATVTVEIPEFEFDPAALTISACDSVVWANAHDQAHTSTGKGDEAWSTGNIAPGAASEPVLFESTGSFAYICALHPFMEGTVTVS